MSSRSSTTAILVLGLVALSAAGCDREAATLELGFRSDVPVVTPDLVTVRVTDGRGTRLLGADDFGNVDANFFRTAPIATATSGTVTVDVALEDAGRSLAEGRVVLDGRPDWGWGVTIHVTDSDPARACFGCFGSLAFPLDPSVARTPADSLWLTWGGNSISDPVVY